MTNDIEFLEAVYERMQQVGMMQSKSEFSTKLLGKGPSYLTSMKARDRNVPPETMELAEGYVVRELGYSDAEICRLRKEIVAEEQAQMHRMEFLDMFAKHRGRPAQNGKLCEASIHEFLPLRSPAWKLFRHLMQWHN